ncbi:MAG: segregation/condensation protein A [Deltaproteobacteria bacterium]|nr:segregation/condensation protein A [Deltaproteobacteria bacterium]
MTGEQNKKQDDKEPTAGGDMGGSDLAVDDIDIDSDGLEQGHDGEGNDSGLPGIRKELEYKLKIGDVFEGPLDLLLFLIRRHELDIFDIPVAFIAERYLEYLDVMRAVNIDIASEYLVMAATLAYIKSRMLLPKGESDDEGEEEDPRKELVRRLLERKRYLDASEQLDSMEVLGRDTFERSSEGRSIEASKGDVPLAPVALFALVDAFSVILKRARVDIKHEVYLDRISVSQRIQELVELMRKRRTVTFFSLFDGRGGRMDLVVTFLALLEMVRLHLAVVKQEIEGGDILIEAMEGIDSHGEFL